MSLKWIKSENFIVDAKEGDVICLLPQTEDKLRDKIIEIAPELFASVISFVENLDNGKYTAKSAYNDFKQILERVPENMIDDAKAMSV